MEEQYVGDERTSKRVIEERTSESGTIQTDVTDGSSLQHVFLSTEQIIDKLMSLLKPPESDVTVSATTKKETFNHLLDKFWNLDRERAESVVFERVKIEEAADPIKLLTALGKYSYLIKTKAAPLKPFSKLVTDPDVERNERHRWGLLEKRCEEEVGKLLSASYRALKDTKYPRILGKTAMEQCVDMDWKQVFTAPSRFHRYNGGIFRHRKQMLPQLEYLVVIEIRPLILSFILFLTSFVLAPLFAFKTRGYFRAMGDFFNMEVTYNCSKCNERHVDLPSVFPLYVHLTHGWSHFLFIAILFARIAVLPTDSAAWKLDVIIFVYWLALLISAVEELVYLRKQIPQTKFRKHYLKTYFGAYKNLLDIMSLLFLFAYLTTRLAGFVRDCNATKFDAELLLTTSGSLYVVRLLCYCKYHHRICPIIYSMVNIFIDWAIAGFVIVVFGLAFSFHLSGIYNANVYKIEEVYNSDQTSFLSSPWNAISVLFWASFGFADRDDGILEAFQEDPMVPKVVKYGTRLNLAVWLLFFSFFLLVWLIALITNKFDKVQEECSVVWKQIAVDLARRHESSETYPVPMNVVCVLIRLFRDHCLSCKQKFRKIEDSLYVCEVDVKKMVSEQYQKTTKKYTRQQKLTTIYSV